MKTRYYILPLAAAALLASCAKEVQEPSNELSAVKTVLTVGINPDTKTYLGNDGSSTHKVYWSNGDQIAVNGTASDALAGLADNTQSTQFTFSGVLSTPYNVLYPASIYEDATHVTLPAIQSYKADGFASGFFPMAGYSADGSNISISHLCSIVKVSILRAAADADVENIAAVRFKGRNNEKVSGTFEIGYSTPTLVAATGASDVEKEVRVIKSLATSTSDAVVYYLVVPARTYSNGFDIIVQDASGHIMTKSKAASTVLEAGHLYSMPEFEFVPTGTELGVTIANAQQLIDFATAYNNKEYSALGSNLIATVTADITFDATSSAAFNATGGIGKKEGVGGATEDNYFNGIFDGGGHTISGLIATNPLFVGTGSGSTVKDFTVDNTCSFTFTHPGTQTEVGSVVGYHKGMMSGVTVNAPVSLADADNVAADTRLGGLVGRIREGIVDNCTYSAAITVPSGFSAADKQISIGGLVGNISNAEGKIMNSSFSGTIENEGQMIASSETTTFKNEPQLMIGGIVGSSIGTVSNCTTSNHATGITVTLNDGSDHDYTGTVVTHSANAYHYAIAGIAGRNDGTVSSCTNNANIVNIFSAERGTSGNMNGRYLNVGGIVGFNKATVSGSDNYGSIVNRANPKVQYVGGVVGRNVGGTISSCDNKSTGSIGVGTSHLTPYGARMLYLGGIIASNESGTVSNIHNAGAITVSRIENTTGIFTRIGGVIGMSTSTVDGSANGGTITNSGAIAQSSGIGKCATPTDANDYGLFLGGIIGYTTASVKNVSNTGNVSYTCTNSGSETSAGGAHYVQLGGISGKINASTTVDVEACVNSGAVQFTASATNKASSYVVYDYNYLGGVAGYAVNADFKGNCSNSGLVKGGDGSQNKNTGNTFWVGGIVGYLTGASSIDHCNLTGSGNPYNDHWSNRGIGSYDCPTVGGIVGQVVGAEGEEIPVSNCSVASTASINARRGAVGGIVGLAQFATISNCTVPINLNGTQSGYFYGGIVVAAQNSTISNCTYSGTTIQSSQLQIGGGIVGQLDADSTVDGCSSSATTVNKNGAAITTTGGIAGKSVTGATIQNSHYASSIAICGDTNFTDGGGNAADL